jgi:hypothetical protein
MCLRKVRMTKNKLNLCKTFSLCSSFSFSSYQLCLAHHEILKCHSWIIIFFTSLSYFSFCLSFLFTPKSFLGMTFTSNSKLFSPLLDYFVCFYYVRQNLFTKNVVEKILSAFFTSFYGRLILRKFSHPWAVNISCLL